MYAKELRTPRSRSTPSTRFTATGFNDHRGYRTAGKGAEPSVSQATLPDDSPRGIVWGHLWISDGEGGYGTLAW
jgi:hypothetical protein